MGLLIAADPTNGKLVVLAPITGGPADRAGIKPGDEVIRRPVGPCAAFGQLSAVLFVYITGMHTWSQTFAVVKFSLESKLSG